MSWFGTHFEIDQKQSSFKTKTLTINRTSTYSYSSHILRLQHFSWVGLRLNKNNVSLLKVSRNVKMFWSSFSLFFASSSLLLMAEKKQFCRALFVTRWIPNEGESLRKCLFFATHSLDVLLNFRIIRLKNCFLCESNKDGRSPCNSRIFYLQILLTYISIKCYKMTIFQSKMYFFICEVKFRIQKDGKYLPRMKRETCIIILSNNIT